MDIHSFARPNEVCVTHLSLDLSLDFDKSEARGTATLALDRRDPKAPLVLDTQGLAIEAIRGTDGSPRAHQTGDTDPNLGAPLTIQLAPADRSVTIQYHTTPAAEAMQWLQPAQTAGGRMPFLFTQGQSTFTRTWIPIQDSPAVRITYDATITAPDGMVALMSAEKLPKRADGKHAFQMKLPIPTYLIALACGDLVFRPISERAGIWAEPPLADRARAEFEDTESMIQAVERLFGPYRWGRYDILVLPPAFPFGGMENPMLTFATPTVLAGDKSLVSLVAHELSHSWSGNLVTNATWSDFWLNEGFTVYLENRIMEEIFGKDRALMEMQLGRFELDREMKELPARDQVLHVDLRGRHADDGFTQVPYQKGEAFLRRIENLVGREAFDAFLKDYFETYAFQSVTTELLVERLQSKLWSKFPDKGKQLNFHLWLYEPGLPGDAPFAVSKALVEVDAAVDTVRAGGTPPREMTSKWVTQQWIRFLTQLPKEISAAELKRLDGIFGFTKSENAEILGEWLRLAVERQYYEAYPRLEQFLMDVGRRKYLKPLYTELAKTDEGKARARAIYAKARQRYHPICQSLVDKILA
jgi:aminopeptidase N